MEQFGARLRRLMAEREMSNGELARRIGKSAAYISLIVNGKRLVDKLPNYDDLRLMARALNVTVDELAGDEIGQSAVAPRPRLLTEQELYERFGIKPYEEPMTADGIYLSAGRGRGVPQGIDDTITRKVKGRRYLWEAPVVGDCMLDEIHPGELVIYNTRLPVEIGRIAVALRDEEELLIKRLALDGEVQVLRPNRGDDVPVDERIRFLGRGVAVQRPL